MDQERASNLEKQRREILESPQLGRLIIALSIPLFVSGSLQSLYSIIDTFWLSRLGSAALGTPTASWPYRGILMSIGFGLASSISALTGQYIGAGDYRKASKVVGYVLGLLMLIGIPGTVIFYLLRGYYLDLAHIPSDVSKLANMYIAVTLVGVVFNYLFLTFNFALGAAGDTKTPMKISVVSTLLNFVLDPIMIFTLRMGVFGAALATVLSAMLSGIYSIYSLATGRHGYKITPRDLVADKYHLNLIMKVSLPPTAQRLLTTLGFLVMMGIVGGLGTPILAAYSIGQVVLSLDHVIVFPLIRSTSIVIAQTLGANLLERARRAALTGLGIMTLLVSIYIGALLIGKDLFIEVFTSDPQVARASHNMLLIFGPSVLGFDILMIAGGIARASGHTLGISILGTIRLWLIRVPASYLLAYPLGMKDIGLWTGMSASNAITGIIALAWILSRRWLKPIIKTPQDKTSKMGP
ncbi:MAG: MATE family efflux transporter [Desulfurococcales archaeon]|nr:MATE family efflux transporter [Desulfurococcales archaeon]